MRKSPLSSAGKEPIRDTQKNFETVHPETKPNLDHDSEDFLPREMLGRSPSKDYFTIEGLARATGASPKDFGRVILKELVDNALDVCEEMENNVTPKLSIRVEPTEANLITISVQDNGPGFDEDRINKLTNSDKHYSSRYFYKDAKRGALGNGWKSIFGLTYILPIVKNIELQNAPVRITSRGKRYDIRTALNGEEAKPKVTTSDCDEPTEGTLIEVSIPFYDDLQIDYLRYSDLVERFAYLNPCVAIHFECPLGPIDWSPVSEELRGAKRERENIHCFGEDEFGDRLVAEAQAKGYDYKIEKFVRSFQFISDLSIEVEGKVLGDYVNQPEKIRRLYQSLRQKSKAPTTSTLKPIGEKPLLRRIKQIDGLVDEDAKKCSRYVHLGQIVEKKVGDNPTSVSFIIEVEAAITQENNRQIILGFNRSPKLEDPFRYFVIPDDNRGRAGIQEILEKNGISKNDSVTVVVNITCNNIQYLDQGKVRIDAVMFWHKVAEAVDKASKFYKRAKRRNCVGENGVVPDTQKNATFQVLAAAITQVSSNGKFRYKQRQLWYVVRELMEKSSLTYFIPDYEYFANTLLPIAAELGFDLSGVLKEANSELHEPHSKKVIPLSTEGEESYQIPSYLYNKILYIEKRGFKDVIVANGFNDRYDMAVIGSQGESSEASRKLLKRIEDTAKKRGERIDTNCIHDADLWGYGIHQTLSTQSKKRKTSAVNIVELGLTITEAVELGLYREAVDMTIGQNEGQKKGRRIPNKVLKCLTDRELQLFTLDDEELKMLDLSDEAFEARTGKPKTIKRAQIINMKYLVSYRVELNAFSPEQFLPWLDKKLEIYGVKKKVRPPDEVVSEKIHDILSLTLNSFVKDAILSICGGQNFVDGLVRILASKVDLNEAKVTEQLDTELGKFPEKEWREIVDDIVSSKATDTLNGKWAYNRIMEMFFKQFDKNNS